MTTDATPLTPEQEAECRASRAAAHTDHKAEWVEAKIWATLDDCRAQLAASEARAKRLGEALQQQGAKDSDGYCFCSERHVEEHSDHMGLRFHSEHCLKTRAALAAKEGE